MAIRLTGNEVKNRGHTYYETRCDECNAVKYIRKDHISNDVKCNAIRHTHPNIAALLNDTENEFNYSVHSGKNAEWKCPICGAVFKRKVSDVVNRGFNCIRCSDKISCPNRYMFALLTQLGIPLEREKIFLWAKNKRYDFYIESESMIIEMNGRQHYEDCGYYQDYKQVHQNDLLKQKLAKENGIDKYICIDARYSDFNFITTNVMNSSLSNVFNVSRVDLQKLENSIQDSIFLSVVDLWNDGNTISAISEVLKISKDKVVKTLKSATRVNMCKYDTLGQSRKWISVAHKINMKKVLCVNSGQLYESINEAAQSNAVSPKALSNCLTGRTKSCGRDKTTKQKIFWKFMED